MCFIFPPFGSIMYAVAVCFVLKHINRGGILLFKLIRNYIIMHYKLSVLQVKCQYCAEMQNAINVICNNALNLC